MIKKILSTTGEGSRAILSGAVIALILKGLAALTAFGFNVLLARLLGAEGTGIYFLSFTIVFIGATLGRFGLDNTVVRFIAIAKTENNPAHLYGIYRKATFITTALSIVITILIEICSLFIVDLGFADTTLVRPLQIMALSLTPIALYTLHAFALQGLKSIPAYVSVLSLFNPLFAVIGVVILAPVWGVEGAVAAYTIGSLLTLLVGFLLWRRSSVAYRSEPPEFNTTVMLESCKPLYASAILRLIIERSSVIFLGFWATSQDIGAFSAAYRLAMLTSLLLVAVNSISSPMFASLYQQKKLSELENVAKTTSTLLTIVATPIFVFMLLFSEFLMGIFGPEFIQGSQALMILAVGQYINLITGSVGYLLVMSGHEKLMRNNLIVNALFCLALNVVLIPKYGALGAAIATAATVSMQNIIALILVKRKLGFFVFPLRLSFSKAK